jgi:hypothetical protein
MVALYKATQASAYLTEASNIHNAIMSRFVNAQTGAIYEPLCETKTDCKSPQGFTWALYKGLVDYYDLADASAKSQISNAVGNSAKLIAAAQCDESWFCMRTLSVGTKFTMNNGTNVRDQIESMEIINALAVVNGFVAPSNIQVAPSKGTTVGTGAGATVSAVPPGTKNSGMKMPGSVTGFIGSLTLRLEVLVAFTMAGLIL